MMKQNADYVASRTWEHRKRDGTMISWHQEDEAAVQSKAEAIAMVQRMIDFWTAKMIDDLCEQRNMSVEDATLVIRKSFHANITDMSRKSSFAQRWEFTVDDFIFP